jgi:hypothetical protein
MKTLFLFILLLCSQAFGALTLYKREMFTNGVVTFSGATVGQFDSVTGALYLRFRGPSLAGESNYWSAQCGRPVGSAAQPAYGVFNMAVTNNANVVASAWFFIKNGTISDTANAAKLLQMRFGGNERMGIWCRSNTIIAQLMGGNQTIPLPVTNQWLWIGLAADNTAGSTFDVRAYYQTLGGAVTQFAITNRDFFGTFSGVTEARFGMEGGGSQNPTVRMGAPSLHYFASFTDIAPAADIDAPEAPPYTWFVNTATGNDTNTGASPSQAWQSAAKIDQESVWVGLFPSPASTQGDSLVIDTSAADLDLTATNLTFSTDGLRVSATNATYWTAKLDVTLTNADFTAQGIPNVFQITTVNTTPFGQSNIVVWEDDKWLAHPTGATWASVSNYIATNAGSFWTDGTTIYVHPLDDTDPTSDGKSYTRSIARSSDGFASAINLSAAYLYFSGLKGGKTAMARTTDNDPLGAYVIGTGTGFGGTSTVANCFAYYSAKHAIGFVADADNSDLTVMDCNAEQGSPYSGAGSQSIWVSFMNGANKSNNVHRYVRCVTVKPSGLIGSTNGTLLNYGGFLMHNSGTGTQFRDIIFDSCSIPYIATAVASNSYVSNCIVGKITSEAVVTNIIVRNRITGGNLADGVSLLTNSYIAHNVFASTNALVGGQSLGSSAVGNSIWENNTFDLSGIPSGDATNRGVIQRNGRVTLLFRNNAVIVPSGKQWTVFEGFDSADTLTISNNVYQLGSSNWVARNYTNSGASDRTFAQWQVLGFDVNSTNVSAIAMTPRYSPLPGSIVIDRGVSLGIAPDITGNIFTNRNDAGAVEHVPPGLFLLTQ